MLTFKANCFKIKIIKQYVLIKNKGETKMKNLVTLETLRTHTQDSVSSYVKNNNIIDNIKTQRNYMSILGSFVIYKNITNDLCSVAMRKLMYKFFVSFYMGIL